MDMAGIVVNVLKLSIVLTVFGFALSVTWRDVTSLFRSPAQLFRAVLAMNVLAPVCAVAIARLLGLRPEIAAVLVAFAISPMPPFLPATQIKAGGDAPYAAGLLAASSLLALVFVPASTWLLAEYFDRSLIAPVERIALIVLVTVLVPLMAGVALRHLMPALATSLARPVSMLAALLLAVSGVALASASWSAIWSLVGDGTLVGIVTFTAAALAIGYLLGGPAADDRSSLALATAARHPAVALAVISANAIDHRSLLAAALLYLIVSMLVTMPFARWRGRRHALSEKTP